MTPKRHFEINWPLKQSHLIFQAFPIKYLESFSLQQTTNQWLLLIRQCRMQGWAGHRVWLAIQYPPAASLFHVCHSLLFDREPQHRGPSKAMRKLERLQFSTSSSFVKIWSACSCEFKTYFWTFWALHHLLFDLESIVIN